MIKDIYLDNSATTRPYEEVIEYVCEINRNVYGNPSSMHTKGLEAEKHIKSARELVAKSLGVENQEIYFTSGGTEANNLAILGFLGANPRKGKHIITTKIEHPSVLEVYKFLMERGYKVDFLDVDDKGIIDLQGLRDAINEETALISIIYINNEVGTVQPISDIVDIKNSKNRETAIHVDAVQAYGKIKIAPKKLGIDLMSMSSHKIHGPKGVGALYASKGLKIRPIFLGGGQESAMRSGTENVSGICGFGMAADITFKKLDENYKECLILKEHFVKRLKEELAEEVLILSPQDSSPYILNVSFANIRAEVLLHHLEMKNIFVSTGSACSSRKNTHSHVLKALGLKPDRIDGAIRFSFSAFNTIEEIDCTITALKDILPKINIRRGGKR
ncbi:cysteine desulfurase family protein [Acetivibrio cellulolyticus]|uniref:cysteine desulfurase family protein n=1 Tax=Acetivibrio cellulolyticus TaxID=35830 RepID=UPI0001E2E2B3|nr:cysteine desulfurase family protein [Acetivibrio cellulolyticus]